MYSSINQKRRTAKEDVIRYLLFFLITYVIIHASCGDIHNTIIIISHESAGLQRRRCSFPYLLDLLANDSSLMHLLPPNKNAGSCYFRQSNSKEVT